MATSPNVQYQVYSNPGQGGQQQVSASTKVVHLARPGGPNSPPGQTGGFQGQVYAAQPQQLQHQQPYAAYSAGAPGGGAYTSAPQPQIFTVGSTSPGGAYLQPQQPPSQQQPQQQYRVMTTPISPSNTGSTAYNTYAQQSPQSVYYGQQQQPAAAVSPQSQQPQQQVTYQQPQFAARSAAATSSQPPASWGQAAPVGQVQGQPQVYYASSPGSTYQPQPSYQQQYQPQPVIQQQHQQQQHQPVIQQQHQQQQQQMWRAAPTYAQSAANQQPISLAGSHQQPQPISAQHEEPIVAAYRAAPPPQQKASGWTSQPQSVASTQLPPQQPRGPPPAAQQQQYYHQQQQQQQSFQPQQAPQPRQRAPSAGSSVKFKTLPMRMAASMDDLEGTQPPQFAAHPVGQATVNEGDPIVLSARVTPAGDSKLKVEWYKNGRPLAAASRHTTSFERGYAVLEFLYTNEDDTGTYFCAATNPQGQAQSSTANITVIPEDSVVTETQLPEESMIANLAAMENQLIQDGLSRSGPRYRDEIKTTQPPIFSKAIAPQVGLKEQDPAHFETVVEPSGDPTLKVEWYKDGQPVSMGCRFSANFDRGFASLDIHYCYPEDSGSYFCIALNSLGQAQSNVVELQCEAAAKILTGSLLSQDSVNYLQSLDSWSSDAMAGYDTVRVEEQEPPSAPIFDIHPNELTVTEGAPVRFMVKAGGFPRPKVFWYMNDELMASHGGSGNWRIYQDGGISYLEIHRAGHSAEFQIKIVARNQHGEAAVDTKLTIVPPADFRPDLKHIQPENPFRKLVQLKKVDRSQELNQAFSRPKTQALNLRRLERDQEARGRSVADQESVDVENLYSRVQSSLRSHRRSSMPSPGPRPTQPLRVEPSAQPQQQQYHAPPPAQTQRSAAPPPQARQAQPPRPAPVSPSVPVMRPQAPPPPQQVVQAPPPQVVQAPPPPPPQVYQAPPPPPVVQAPPPPPVVQAPPPPPVVQAPPPPPPPPPIQAPAPAPPPPPPPAPAPPPPQPVVAMATAQQMNAPEAHSAETEYLHSETSAEFTIEL